MIAMPSAFSILLTMVDDPDVGLASVPAYIYGNIVQLGLLLLWIGYFTSIGDVAEDISTEFQKVFLKEGYQLWRNRKVLSYRKSYWQCRRHDLTTPLFSGNVHPCVVQLLSLSLANRCHVFDSMSVSRRLMHRRVS